VELDIYLDGDYSENLMFIVSSQDKVFFHSIIV